MKHKYLTAALACLLGIAASETSLAEEQDIDGAENCITVSQIRTTRVVDDLNILFYMTGKTVYQNILPRPCHGLARENRFAYRVTTGQLCHIDSIQILYNAGSDVLPGRSCRLGYFHEITEEDADFMIENPPEDLRGTPPAEPPPPAEPEEVIKETDES